MKKIVTILLGVVILLSFGIATALETSKLYATIRKSLEIPYKLGGSSTITGMDCSAFIIYIFEKLGVKTRFPRTSTEQFKIGKEISKEELRPGDLVFFNTNGGNSISHVGIYLGEGEFAHASTSKGTCIDKLDTGYFNKHYVSACRVMDDEEYALYVTDNTTDN